MRKKGSRILPAILVLILVVGCQHPKPKDQDLMRIKSANGENTKKVIFLLVDSLMAQAIDQGIKEQELPTFQFLIEHGQYYKEMVSSFPTMSVTIDSSLVTGKYPDAHHVPGLIWYSTDNKKVINYGTGPMEILRHGINPVLADALIHLNGSHLNRKLPTIYEDLAQQGLTSGSINGLIYRGTVNHTLSIPEWIQGPTSLTKEIQVKGPDFLLVYLSDLDQKLHKKGPVEWKGVKELDQQLQSMLQTFGSPEKALNEAIIIIAGDTGMTQILPAEQNPVIDLPSLFGDAKVLRPGEAVSKETEIILAVNETMAYVYPLQADRSLRDVAKLIEKDPRIDFIAWKEKGCIYGSIHRMESLVPLIIMGTDQIPEYLRIVDLKAYLLHLYR